MIIPLQPRGLQARRQFFGKHLRAFSGTHTSSGVRHVAAQSEATSATEKLRSSRSVAMPRSKDASVSIEPVIELADESAQTGQRTAKIAAEILRECGFVIPTAAEREAILIAFVRAGYVIYGKAFDVLKCSAPVDLTSSDDILKNIEQVTLFEVKSTNKPSVKPSFRGYFFSLSTAELLVAQNLGKHYRFAFVNTRTRKHEELTLLDVFQRARGIYPTWSIQF